jgi:hypothetical protein
LGTTLIEIPFQDGLLLNGTKETFLFTPDVKYADIGVPSQGPYGGLFDQDLAITEAKAGAQGLSATNEAQALAYADLADTSFALRYLGGGLVLGGA